jgi:hypothetical protein
MRQTECDYQLSAKQLKFIKIATKYGHKIFYDYSGRGMFGKKCPAYECNNISEVMGDYLTDNMGKGYVVYCP